MLEYLIIGTCFVLLVAIAFFLFGLGNKQEDPWAVFAATHGFKYDTKDGAFDEPVVYGEIDGRSFFMGCIKEWVDEKRYVLTMMMTLELKGILPMGLNIHRNVFTSSFTHTLADRKTIKTNDPEFDNKVGISCANEFEALEYLIPERKEAIRQLLQMGGCVDGRILKFVTDQKITSIKKITSIFEALCDFAHIFDVRHI